ncbi:MAG: MarR family winged helix-turn-helix transcriptional regulator [Pseudonocardia sp.]
MTPGGQPLARLFAIGFRDLVDGLHERLAMRGWHDVRRSYGFVLLAARGDGAQVGEIAALLGVTKQAASKLVAAMEEAGYVRRVVDPADGRARTVALTSRGLRLLDAVEEIYVELEGQWAAVLGADRVEALRADLETVLRRGHGGRLPPVRPGGG